MQTEIPTEPGYYWVKLTPLWGVPSTHVVRLKKRILRDQSYILETTFEEVYDNSVFTVDQLTLDYKAQFVGPIADPFEPNARRQPTVMPDWLKKQFDNAEATVATWSDGKCEAAGIPRKPTGGLGKQMEKCKETVDDWPDAKRIAAGLPPKSYPTLDEQIKAVQALANDRTPLRYRNISAILDSLQRLKDLEK